MFEKEAEEAKQLYDKIYKQGYPPSQIQHAYWPWARGYFACGYASVDPLAHKVLLDVGCGRQIVKVLVEDTFPRHVYLGLDVAPSVKPFYRCSAHQIPIQNNGVEFVWSCDFIEHVQENMVELCLSEMERVLNNRGFISVCTKPSGRNVGGKNLHLTVQSEKWWQKTLAKFFVIDDSWSPQIYSRGYLFRKKQE